MRGFIKYQITYKWFDRVASVNQMWMGCCTGRVLIGYTIICILLAHTNLGGTANTYKTVAFHVQSY